jgi:hypothetical protein
MPDDRLLRIGTFSRASWLSIKALRAYHESGLLVSADRDQRARRVATSTPAFVTQNGTRYVTAVLIQTLVVASPRNTTSS